MEVNKKVCVVVPVFNRLELTLRFIKSFSKSTYRNFQILIFDDGSDNTSEYILKNFPEVVVLKGDGNYWWSGATNEGVKYAAQNGFDYLLTINNDSTPDRDLLKNLIKCAEKNPNSIVGARIMMGETKKVWAIGVNVNFIKFPFLELSRFGSGTEQLSNLDTPLLVDALPGNGVLVPIDVYKKIGLYDSKWCPLYHGDTEFTYRATIKGIKCLVDLDAVVTNNGYVADPKFSIRQGLISKKSPYYWRAAFIFYLRYAPLFLKIFYFKQLLWIPKRIIKRIFNVK